jgi:hypothetical protein
MDVIFFWLEVQGGACMSITMKNMKICVTVIGVIRIIYVVQKMRNSELCLRYLG